MLCSDSTLIEVYRKIINFQTKTKELVMTKTKSNAVKYYMLILVIASLTFFSGCSNDKKYLDNVDETVQKFWQAQIQGKWHECYGMYAEETLRQLAKASPKVFKSSQSYALRKNAESEKAKLVAYKVVSKQIDKDQMTAKIRLGLKFNRGKPEALIEQNWKFNKKAKKWEIVGKS